MSRSCVDQGQACLSPLVGVKVKVDDHLLIKAELVSMCWSQGALLDLHLLESSSREEKVGLIKALCGLINSQVQVKICRRGASSVLVYGGGSCESSPKRNRRKVVHLEEMKIVFIDLKWFKRKAKV